MSCAASTPRRRSPRGSPCCRACRARRRRAAHGCGRARRPSRRRRGAARHRRRSRSRSPLPAFTNSRCSVVRQPSRCSPSAITLTSLSTSTGAPSAPRRTARRRARRSSWACSGSAGAAGRGRDRRGQPDADAAHVAAAAPDLLEQRVEALDEPRQDHVGSVAGVDLLDRLGQHVRVEVGDRNVAARAPQLGGEHDAEVGVEAQHRRPAPARRGAAARRHQQALREQRVDALRDGRAREAGQLRQLGARRRAALADQLEHRARSARRGGGR